MKKVALVAYDLGQGDAQKLLRNTALALRATGVEVRAIIKGADQALQKELGESKIEIASLGPKTHNSLDKAMEHEFLATSKKASKVLDDEDVCLVIDEEAVMFSELKKGPAVFWSQGPFFLTAIQGKLQGYGSLTKKLFELGVARCASRYSAHLKAYDGLIANCNACAALLRYVAGRCPDAVIYPPVDPSLCANPEVATQGDHVLLLGDEKDPAFQQLAKALGAVGKVEVVSLAGYKEKAYELSSTYAQASFTVVDDPLGLMPYAPLESMLCGTPVLTYDHGGTAEIISGAISVSNVKPARLTPGYTGNTLFGETPGKMVKEKLEELPSAGWLAHTRHELEEEAKFLMTQGYPISLRKKVREKALALSLEKTGPSLLALLERATREANRKFST